MPMRRLLTLLSLLLCACTIEKQDGDLRVLPPPILADQSWHITQQETLPDGARVCTAHAGELDVTQRTAQGGLATQVAFSSGLDPGARFKVLVSGHVYETMDNRFSSRDSAAIIQDFLHADKVYTELRVIDIEGDNKHKDRIVDNDFSLQSFAGAFQTCERFVRK